MNENVRNRNHMLCITYSVSCYLYQQKVTETCTHMKHIQLTCFHHLCLRNLQ
jgi:hypothetical protein